MTDDPTTDPEVQGPRIAKLWRAVLVQGAVDYVNKQPHPPLLRGERSAVTAWVHSDERGVLGRFASICDLLGLDLLGVREQIVDRRTSGGHFTDKREEVKPCAR